MGVSSFGGDGIVLKDVLGALRGLGGVLEVLGVFSGRFMGCWGRLGVLGTLWDITIHVRCLMKYR